MMPAPSLSATGLLPHWLSLPTPPLPVAARSLHCPVVTLPLTACRCPLHHSCDWRGSATLAGTTLPLCVRHAFSLIISDSSNQANGQSKHDRTLGVGQPPFYTNSIYSLIHLIVKDPIKWPDGISANFRSFLKGLLNKIPSKRLTWPDLAVHDFVKDYKLAPSAPVKTIRSAPPKSRPSATADKQPDSNKRPKPGAALSKATKPTTAAEAADTKASPAKPPANQIKQAAAEQSPNHSRPSAAKIDSITKLDGTQQTKPVDRPTSAETAANILARTTARSSSSGAGIASTLWEQYLQRLNRGGGFQDLVGDADFWAHVGAALASLSSHETRDAQDGKLCLRLLNRLWEESSSTQVIPTAEGSSVLNSVVNILASEHRAQSSADVTEFYLLCLPLIVKTLPHAAVWPSECEVAIHSFITEWRRLLHYGADPSFRVHVYVIQSMTEILKVMGNQPIVWKSSYERLLELGVLIDCCKCLSRSFLASDAASDGMAANELAPHTLELLAELVCPSMLHVAPFPFQLTSVDGRSNKFPSRPEFVDLKIERDVANALQQHGVLDVLFGALKTTDPDSLSMRAHVLKVLLPTCRASHSLAEAIGSRMVHVSSLVGLLKIETDTCNLATLLLLWAALLHHVPSLISRLPSSGSGEHHELDVIMRHFQTHSDLVVVSAAATALGQTITVDLRSGTPKSTGDAIMPEVVKAISNESQLSTFRKVVQPISLAT